MVDFWTVLVSFTIAVGVALFVRYKIKPKHEEVFDYNRKSNIVRIFGLLDHLDFQFRYFIEYFEKDMGELTKDRKTVLPERKFEKTQDGGYVVDITDTMGIGIKYEQVKPELKRLAENLRMLEKSFLSDYSIYLNYVHDSFLRDIRMYFLNTAHYAEWLLKDTHLAYLRKKRMESAKKIIEYVEKDKSLVSNPLIKKFIEKWEEEFPKFKNS